MITFAYRHCYIHCNYDGSVTVQDPNFKLYQVKSVRAAKILITKLLRSVK